MRITLFLLCAFAACIPSVAQVWKVTGDLGAPVTVMRVNSKGMIFLGSGGSGVYRSTNKGADWIQKKKGLEYDMPIQSLYIDADDRLFAAQRGSGVFLSTDDGDNWTSITATLPSQNIMYCAGKSVKGAPTKLFLCIDDPIKNIYALYYSENNGTTWTALTLPGVHYTAVYSTGLSPVSDALYISIGYNMGFFRAANVADAASGSWRRIENSSAGESDDNFSIVESSPQGHMFLGRNQLSASTNSKNAVVLRSTNDGSSWEYLTNGWPTGLTFEGAQLTNNLISGICCTANNMVYVSTAKSGSYKSSNNGDTWERIADTLPSSGSASAIVYDKDTSVFMAPAGDNSVYGFVPDIPSSVDDIYPRKLRIGSIYPNPANDHFTVPYELLVPTHVRLELFNTAGVQVGETFETEAGAGSHEVRLMAHEVPAGVYFYRLSIGSEVKTQSVTITH